MTLNRRSFSLLAATGMAAFVFVTAAAAHIIWEPYEQDVTVGTPSVTYPFTTSAKSYSRTFPVTISKPSNMTVSGPSSITLPANATTVTATYTISGAAAGNELDISHSDANNTWGRIYYFH